MFGLFRRPAAAALAHRCASAIRSDTRALLRLANASESVVAPSAEPGQRTGAVISSDRAMADAERRLANSISAARPDDLSTQAIIDHVICPVLDETVVVSANARAAIRRAVSAAHRSTTSAGDDVVLR